MYIPDENLPPPRISSRPPWLMRSRPASRLKGQDFTIQQNGWTVLQNLDAPMPQTEQLEQPPPYTPPAMPQTLDNNIAQVSNLNDNQNLRCQTLLQHHDIEITFERPQRPDDASEDAQYFRMSFKTSFDEGFRHICKEMGLEYCAATIGYKYDKDPAHANPTCLENAAAWLTMLEKAVHMIKNARTQKVRVILINITKELENMNPRNLKFDANKRTIETLKFQELKKALFCEAHKNFCFVILGGDHHHIDNYHQTLWAKEMVVRDADVDHPPENIVFQDYFLPKKNTAKHACYGAAIPEIHVTVNNHPWSSPVSTVTLLTTTCKVNTSPSISLLHCSHMHNWSITPPGLSPQPGPSWLSGTGSNSQSCMVSYPTTVSILEAIDSAGHFAALEFPVAIFADKLKAWSITHVSQVPILEPDFYINQIGMTPELADA